MKFYSIEQSHIRSLVAKRVIVPPFGDANIVVAV